jgi:A/G-specific adenine glycosylase
MMLPDSTQRRVLRGRLLAWYDVQARDLPWRRRGDPYAVWVSEIMLQQTQVATVTAYFQRFMAALPTLETLAQADEHDVLRLWEGLGYYRRARQLHQAAKIIVDRHGGQFPTDPQVVRRLPGIGRYTAGAILSIAFDLRQPIVEANTLRLFSRLLGYRGDPRSTEGRRLLWSMAEILLPRRGAGRFNQALMELGSEVCKARAPECGVCPIAPFCRAHQQGRQSEIPLPKPKRVFEAVREAAIVVRRNGRVLLLRRPDGGRWAGLWDFPRVPLECGTHPPNSPTRSSTASSLELARNVLALTGVSIVPGAHLTTLTHAVTRFRITLECYEAKYVFSRTAAASLQTCWAKPSQLGGYALSSTGRKLANLITRPTGARARKKKIDG